jgi:hypothetical protein
MQVFPYKFDRTLRNTYGFSQFLSRGISLIQVLCGPVCGLVSSC